MDCDDCPRLNRMFLESLVAADKAETALRVYFLTHLAGGAGVSDLDEYRALRAAEQQAAEDRHHAYLALVDHHKLHD